MLLAQNTTPLAVQPQFRFMDLAMLIENYLMYALSIVVVCLAVWAFVDCVRRPAQRFAEEGKRTKGWWTALTGGGTAIALISAIPNGGGGGGFLQLIAACVVCVYLADVKPAVSGKGGNWYNY